MADEFSGGILLVVAFWFGGLTIWRVTISSCDSSGLESWSANNARTNAALFSPGTCWCSTRNCSLSRASSLMQRAFWGIAMSES